MARKPKPMQRRIKEAIQPDENGCWIWMLGRDKHGYGRIKVGRGMQLAHRMSYEAFEASIPEDMVIDHLCRVRCCVNPAHMRVVTVGENTLSGNSFSAINARKTTCPKGHPYSGVNSLGGRICATCQTANALRYRAKRREMEMRDGYPSSRHADHHARHGDGNAASHDPA